MLQFNNKSNCISNFIHSSVILSGKINTLSIDHASYWFAWRCENIVYRNVRLISRLISTCLWDDLCLFDHSNHFTISAAIFFEIMVTRLAHPSFSPILLVALTDLVEWDHKSQCWSIFVRDGINSVADYNSSRGWKMMSSVCLSVCAPFWTFHDRIIFERIRLEGWNLLQSTPNVKLLLGRNRHNC